MMVVLFAPKLTVFALTTSALVAEVKSAIIFAMAFGMMKIIDGRWFLAQMSILQPDKRQAAQQKAKSETQTALTIAKQEGAEIIANTWLIAQEQLPIVLDIAAALIRHISQMLA